MNPPPTPPLADCIAEAWQRGLGLAQAQGYLRRRTGQTLDRETIRAAFVDLSEIHS